MENNFREILFLIEQIDVLKSLLRDMKDGVRNHSWPVHQEAVQDQATAEILDEARRAGAWKGVKKVSSGLLISFLLPTGYQLTLACVLWNTRIVFLLLVLFMGI